MNTFILTLALLTSTSTGSSTSENQTLALTAAIVPGVVVHGAGHFVRGDNQTGWFLLAAEGIGLASTLLGGTGLALTGGSQKTIVPFAWMMMQGVGLFSLSWFADIYGSLNLGEGPGRAQRRTPEMKFQLGYQTIYDPVFTYRNLAMLAATTEWRALRFSLNAWSALDDDNQKLRLQTIWRLFGPRSKTASPSGDFLDLRLAGNWHRYGTEQFTMTTGELALRGRIDGRRIGKSLRGLFFEAELGLAGGATTHTETAAESTGLLLGGFGMGVYLGHEKESWGEWVLKYDHRHDGYLAGAKLPSLGSGIPGHLLTTLDTQIHGPWGLRVEAGIGSAWMGGLSILYQTGGSK